MLHALEELRVLGNREVSDSQQKSPDFIGASKLLILHVLLTSKGTAVRDPGKSLEWSTDH